MIAVDFAFTRPSVATLEAHGVGIVIRYLTGTGLKPIGRAELDAYLAAGIAVVFVYEGFATDATGGFSAGATHARQANAALLALGLSTPVPVYFAVDESIVPANAVPYFQGIASVRPASTNGCYGEGGLTSRLRTMGLTAFSWQSESKAFPGNATTDPTANLQQVYGASPIPGTDLDLICQPDVGQWPRPADLTGGTVPPGAADVVDTFDVPGSLTAYLNLMGDGGLDAYGGAIPTQFEYIAVANDGARYHFGPKATPGVFCYPGLPASARQGTRYFVKIIPIAYQGVAVPTAGPRGPAGPEGPPGPAGTGTSAVTTIEARLTAAAKALTGG